mmetsp:Transcript_16117/g.49246  ORF Transcript_16117/g.49246 Transcript_16117/m.49246 type:complete len:336 (-) Transcript_16117:215-1222(-)
MVHAPWTMELRSRLTPIRDGVRVRAKRKAFNPRPHCPPLPSEKRSLLSFHHLAAETSSKSLSSKSTHCTRSSVRASVCPMSRLTPLVRVILSLTRYSFVTSGAGSATRKTILEGMDWRLSRPDGPKAVSTSWRRRSTSRAFSSSIARAFASFSLRKRMLSSTMRCISCRASLSASSASLRRRSSISVRSCSTRATRCCSSFLAALVTEDLRFLPSVCVAESLMADCTCFHLEEGLGWTGLSSVISVCTPCRSSSMCSRRFSSHVLLRTSIVPSLLSDPRRDRDLSAGREGRLSLSPASELSFCRSDPDARRRILGLDVARGLPEAAPPLTPFAAA